MGHADCFPGSANVVVFCVGVLESPSAGSIAHRPLEIDLKLLYYFIHSIGRIYVSRKTRHLCWWWKLSQAQKSPNSKRKALLKCGRFTAIFLQNIWKYSRLFSYNDSWRHYTTLFCNFVSVQMWKVSHLLFTTSLPSKVSEREPGEKGSVWRRP